MLRILAALPASLLRHLHTLFLFTKSDFKTTVIPITVLAAAAAPLRSATHLPHVLFWIWLHVLQFDVSNQSLVGAAAEDAHNKRDRPLPAGRITRRAARVLRWTLVPLCWALSACYSAQTVCASVALVALTVLYDELGAHSGHWVVRNLVNAAGFASFEVGTTLVAGTDHSHLDYVALASVLASAGIFATTIQAQDFKDTEGDRLIGRKTLPIVLPTLARPTLMLAILAWSVGLSIFWHASTLVALAFAALGAAVGACFMTAHSVQADQRAFYMYNIWLSAAHALPMCWRLYFATA